MESSHLKETLSEIELEVGRAERLDDETRVLLARLQAAISTLLTLDDEERTDEERQSLAEMLKESIDHFEVDHPKLTMAMGRLANALSGMGI